MVGRPAARAATTGGLPPARRALLDAHREPEPRPGGSLPRATTLDVMPHDMPCRTTARVHPRRAWIIIPWDHRFDLVAAGRDWRQSAGRLALGYTANSEAHSRRRMPCSR